MKFSIVFYLIFFTLLSIKLTKSNRKLQVFNNGTRFRSIECRADNYTSSIKYCFIKAFSRRVTTLNVGIKQIRPANKPVFVQMVLFYRYGNVYREVIDTKKREWCSIMEGLTTHLFFMQIIRQIKDSAAAVLHKCPYVDDLDIKNLTLHDGKTFDLYPEGIYKFSWINYNRTTTTWRFNVSLQIRSLLKESMG